MSEGTLDEGESRSLLAAEAHARLEKAQQHSRLLAAALGDADNALLGAGYGGLRDQLAKIIELHRLADARIGVMAKRVAEGGY